MNYAEIAIADGSIFDTDAPPRCEYRSPEYDGGTGVGRMRRCPDDATMYTDRGLRCDRHAKD